MQVVLQLRRQPLDEYRVIVAQDCAELTRSKVEHAITLDIDEVRTFASGNDVVHERLHGNQIVAVLFPGRDVPTHHCFHLT